MESPLAKNPLLQPAWLRVIVFVLVYLGINLVVYRLMNTGISFVQDVAARVGAVSGSSDPNFNLMLLTLFVSFIISVALAIIFTKYVDRQDISYLGFQYKGHLPDGMVGLFIPFVIIGGVSLILYFTNNLEWTDISFDTGDFLNGLFLMIAIAVGEEIIFRGYILNNLMQSLNRWLALAISAALFALMHSNNPNVDVIAMINLFIGGLLLGINFVFTRNLWFSIFMHTSWNFFQGPVLGFPVSGVQLQSVIDHELKGNPFLTGGSFGLEASIVTGILMFIAIIALYLAYRYGSVPAVNPS